MHHSSDSCRIRCVDSHTSSECPWRWNSRLMERSIDANSDPLLCQLDVHSFLQAREKKQQAQQQTLNAPAEQETKRRKSILLMAMEATNLQDAVAAAVSDASSVSAAASSSASSSGSSTTNGTHTSSSSSSTTKSHITIITTPAGGTTGSSPEPLSATAKSPAPVLTPTSAASSGGIALSDEWLQYTDPRGRTYYYSTITKKSTWKDPRTNGATLSVSSDALPSPSASPQLSGVAVASSASSSTTSASKKKHRKTKQRTTSFDLSAPINMVEWKSYVDAKSGRTYWYHAATSETTWMHPEKRYKKMQLQREKLKAKVQNQRNQLQQQQQIHAQQSLGSAIPSPTLTASSSSSLLLSPSHERQKSARYLHAHASLTIGDVASMKADQRPDWSTHELNGKTYWFNWQTSESTYLNPELTGEERAKEEERLKKEAEAELKESEASQSATNSKTDASSSSSSSQHTRIPSARYLHAQLSLGEIAAIPASERPEWSYHELNGKPYWFNWLTSESTYLNPELTGEERRKEEERLKREAELELQQELDESELEIEEDDDIDGGADADDDISTGISPNPSPKENGSNGGKDRGSKEFDDDADISDTNSINSDSIDLDALASDSARKQALEKREKEVADATAAEKEQKEKERKEAEATLKRAKTPPAAVKASEDSSLFWTAHRDRDGRLYYYNTATKVSSWNDPWKKDATGATAAASVSPPPSSPLSPSARASSSSPSPLTVSTTLSYSSDNDPLSPMSPGGGSGPILTEDEVESAWKSYVDKGSGKQYWYNSKTKVSCWSDPRKDRTKLSPGNVPPAARRASAWARKQKQTLHSVMESDEEDEVEPLEEVVRTASYNMKMMNNLIAISESDKEEDEEEEEEERDDEDKKDKKAVAITSQSSSSSSTATTASNSSSSTATTSPAEAVITTASSSSSSSSSTTTTTTPTTTTSTTDTFDDITRSLDDVISGAFESMIEIGIEEASPSKNTKLKKQLSELNGDDESTVKTTVATPPLSSDEQSVQITTLDDAIKYTSTGASFIRFIPVVSSPQKREEEKEDGTASDGVVGDACNEEVIQMWCDFSNDSSNSTITPQSARLYWKNIPAPSATTLPIVKDCSSTPHSLLLCDLLSVNTGLPDDLHTKDASPLTTLPMNCQQCLTLTSDPTASPEQQQKLLLRSYHPCTNPISAEDQKVYGFDKRAFDASEKQRENWVQALLLLMQAMKDTTK